MIIRARPMPEKLKLFPPQPILLAREKEAQSPKSLLHVVRGRRAHKSHLINMYKYLLTTYYVVYTVVNDGVHWISPTGSHFLWIRGGVEREKK